MSEPTIGYGGRRITIPEAREILGIPEDECFGCFLGDAGPEMHDLEEACEWQGGRGGVLFDFGEDWEVL